MLRRLIPPLDHDSFREGFREMLPFGIPTAVWGFVTGVAMVNIGMSVAEALLMTVAVFAGAAQLAVAPLLVVGTPWPVVWVTATLVNLRFVIFSAAARRSFVMLTWPQRIFAGYFNGDIGFALFSRRFAADTVHGTPEQHGFFFGGASVNWTAWQLSSITGILLGDLAPTDWGLDLAANLALLSVLVPMAMTVPAAAGVATSILVAITTVTLPMRLGLFIAVVAGVTVAMLGDTLRERMREAR